MLIVQLMRQEISVVWHLSLPLNSFNKTEAAIFPMQATSFLVFKLKKDIKLIKIRFTNLISIGN